MISLLKDHGHNQQREIDYWKERATCREQIMLGETAAERFWAKARWHELRANKPKFDSGEITLLS